MTNFWDEIKTTIENIETKKALETIQAREDKDRKETFPVRTKHLNFIGALCTGVSVGIFSFIFNYLLFVWLLHIEF